MPEKMGEYDLIQLDSGHWYGIAPNGDESNIHWSKTEIRAWVKTHRRERKVP